MSGYRAVQETCRCFMCLQTGKGRKKEKERNYSEMQQEELRCIS